MFEGAVGSGETPTLAALAARGVYRRATSVFPSLTPVCLSSIATGAHGDIHEIPHLVWYDRHEQRLVEYGSSFGAVRAAGIGRTLRDTLVNMNRQHLGAGALTLFESLADAGLRTAAVNFTAYRGPDAAPVVAAAARRRDGARAILLLQPLQLRSHRCAALLAQSLRRDRSTPTRRRSAAGS